MLKSEIYHLAQIAVITSPCITPETKLEVLGELMEKEDLEIFCEKQKAMKERESNAETV